MKGDETIRVVAACVKGRVPVLIKGYPGLGKSGRLGALARRWRMYFEPITGSNRDSTDFLGLPVEGEHRSPDGSIHKVQRYTSLDWVRRLNDACVDGEHDGAICFLDEFNTQEDTMKAMLRVLEERHAGPDKFHDNVALVAAMNPTSIATGGIDLPAAVANRMIHLEWDFDFDHWADGFINGFEVLDEPRLDELTVEPTDATRARTNALIIGFLRAKEDLRSAFPGDDPDAASGAWPSPRMWTKAAAALVHLHPDDEAAQRMLLIGAVGKAAATAYITWARQMDLYDPEEVLADPRIVDWTSRPDRLYAMTMAVTSLVRARDDSALWRKALEMFAYGSQQGRSDTAWVGARLLFNNPPSDGKAGVPAKVRKEFHENMKAIGLLTDELAA